MSNDRSPSIALGRKGKVSGFSNRSCFPNSPRRTVLVFLLPFNEWVTSVQYVLTYQDPSGGEGQEPSQRGAGPGPGPGEALNVVPQYLEPVEGIEETFFLCSTRNPTFSGLVIFSSVLDVAFPCLPLTRRTTNATLSRTKTPVHDFWALRGHLAQPGLQRNARATRGALPSPGVPVRAGVQAGRESSGRRGSRRKDFPSGIRLSHGGGSSEAHDREGMHGWRGVSGSIATFSGTGSTLL